MTPRQAAYEVAHHGRLSLTALAVLLKKSPTTLAHELRPPEGSVAKLGLDTAIQITQAQNDDRILLAWAEQRGYHCVPITNSVDGKNTKTLLEATCYFAKETGEALAAMHHAIESGRITERNVHCFEREVSEIAPAAIALVKRMRAVAADQAKARAATPAQAGMSLPLKKSQALSATL